MKDPQLIKIDEGPATFKVADWLTLNIDRSANVTLTIVNASEETKHVVKFDNDGDLVSSEVSEFNLEEDHDNA